MSGSESPVKVSLSSVIEEVRKTRRCVHMLTKCMSYFDNDGSAWARELMLLSVQSILEAVEISLKSSSGVMGALSKAKEMLGRAKDEALYTPRLRVVK